MSLRPKSKDPIYIPPRQPKGPEDQGFLAMPGLRKLHGLPSLEQVLLTRQCKGERTKQSLAMEDGGRRKESPLAAKRGQERKRSTSGGAGTGTAAGSENERSLAKNSPKLNARGVSRKVSKDGPTLASEVQGIANYCQLSAILRYTALR
jgi:hypothetical protein